MTTPHYEGLVRITAPVSEPLTLAETKAYLRITHDDDNSRLLDMITAVRMLAEQWLKRSLITQSWALHYSGALAHEVRLLMGPVQSITSITCYDEANNPTVIAASNYALSLDKNKLLLLDTLRGYQIELVYVAGYGSAGELPRPLKLGLLAHVASMVDGTVGLAALPVNVLQFYMPYRELVL